jgi:nitrate reductase NapE component
LFCLDDGTTLTSRAEPQETLRIDAARPTDLPIVPPATPAYQPPARRSRWPIFILIALVVFGLVLGVIGVGIFGYWRMSASSNSNDEPQSDKRPDSWAASPSPSASATPRGSASVVGVWRTNVTEDGQETEITVAFLANGNTRYLFKDPQGRTSGDTGTWQYSDEILFERFSNGASGKSSIRWIDDNTVELTIIDNGVPAYSGLKRTYYRVK